MTSCIDLRPTLITLQPLRCQAFLLFRASPEDSVTASMLGHSARRYHGPGTLQHNRPILSGDDPSDPIDLGFTPIAQVVESHAVVILLLDDLLQCVLHAQELLLGQVALEDTELYALTKIFQRLMDAGSPLIIADVIRDHQIHS
jgi:hypothetical protein